MCRLSSDEVCVPSQKLEPAANANPSRSSWICRHQMSKPSVHSMQLGLKHEDRNALEDTKRVVEQLRKNGTVDNLHSQAIAALFNSDVFLSEVRQYLQQSQGPKQAAIESIQEMALSALSGLLAGTYNVQQQQPAVASTAPGAANSSRPARQQQQQQQQQQSQQLPQQRHSQQQPRLGPGQQQQQQQGLLQRQGLPASQRQQQRPQISIPDDVSLKLQLALIQMLETEERFLQTQFKLYYERIMQQLPNDRQLQAAAFTAEPPKDVSETPLSPKSRYNASEFELEQSEQQQQAGLPQQQYQQQVLGASQH